jgi:hypothetical protein
LTPKSSKRFLLQDTAPITGMIDVEVLFMVASSWLLKFDFNLDLQRYYLNTLNN